MFRNVRLGCIDIVDDKRETVPQISHQLQIDETRSVSFCFHVFQQIILTSSSKTSVVMCPEFNFVLNDK